MGKRHVNPGAINSQAVVKPGTPVFLAGQVGTGPDAAAQADEAFASVRSVVEACGGTMDDVVKITIYTTELDARPGIADVRRKHFREGEHPATTYIVVAGLAAPEYLVEVEAVAILDLG